MSTRVECPESGSKGRITSRNKQATGFFVLYCSCNNVAECGATFTYDLTVGHILNPSRKNVVALAEALVKQASLDLGEAS